MSPHHRLAAAVAATALLLTACSQDDEVIGGTVTPTEEVTTDVEIVGVELEYPDDEIWEPGEDVPLYAAITNDGGEPVRLVSVEGEAFGDAVLVDLSGNEGSIEIAANDNAYLEPDGAPSVLLMDLEESLRSSQSIDVTFVFDSGEEATLRAMVESAPPGDGDFEAPEDPTPDDN